MPRRLLASLAALASSAACAGAADAAGAAVYPSWTTYHGDVGRSGLDPGQAVPHAPTLSWTASLDGGQVYAQPLIVGSRVFAATTAGALYALDAASGAALWHAGTGTPVLASTLPCGTVTPTVGIVSTPVIDGDTIFVVSDVQDAIGNAQHELFGFRLEDGMQVLQKNVDPPGSNHTEQAQRPALTVSHGRVVIGFGGNNGDCGTYHGWVASVAEDGSAPDHFYEVATITGDHGGALWAPSGPAVDPSGTIYASTGNGYSTTQFDRGESILKLDSSMSELGYFAPSSWAADNAADLDLGSAGPILLPGDELFQAGKNRQGYLVSTANPGGIDGQLYTNSVCGGGGSFGGDAFFAGTIFVACTNGVRALAYTAQPAGFSEIWHGPGDANGTPTVADGLVWVESTSSNKMYGLDPASGRVAAEFPTDPTENFASPSAGAGQLYLPTVTGVSAYSIGTPIPPSPGAAPAPATPSAAQGAAGAATTTCPGCSVVPAKGKLRLPRGRLRLRADRRGRVRLSLVCLRARCVGKLTLTYRGLRIASVHYNLAPNGTRRTQARLTHRGRVLLRRHGGRLKIVEHAGGLTRRGSLSG